MIAEREEGSYVGKNEGSLVQLKRTNEKMNEHERTNGNENGKRNVPGVK